MEIFLNTVPGFLHLSLLLVLWPVLFLAKGVAVPACPEGDWGGEMKKEPQISAISLLFLLDCICTDLHRGLSSLNSEALSCCPHTHPA